MAQGASPRSLLMGHQLRREHYYLLERLDKIEQVVVKKQIPSPVPDDRIEAAVKNVLASECGDQLHHLNEAQSSLLGELEEQKKSAFAVSLGILRRLEELEQHRQDLDKKNERLDTKADASAVADCNRVVQTLMTLVQQTARDVKDQAEGLSSLETRLGIAEASMVAAQQPVHDARVSSVIGLSCEKTPEPHPAVISKDDGNSNYHWTEPQQDHFVPVPSFTSSPPLAATLLFRASPPPIEPLSIVTDQIKKQAGVETEDSKIAKVSRKRKKVQVAQMSVAGETQRLTRSHRGMQTSDELLSAWDDPDKILRRAKAKGEQMHADRVAAVAQHTAIAKPTEAIRGPPTPDSLPVKPQVQPGDVIEHPLIAHVRALSRMGSAAQWEYPSSSSEQVEET